MQANNHIWSFSSVGGIKRVNLETGSDLANLDQLDQKLWTALSCPVDGLEIDKKTLQLIDLDNDGQIRVPEIIHAVKWILSLIKNQDEILKSNPNLDLSLIDDSTDLGKNLLASAQVILKSLDKENQSFITVEDTSDTERIFSKSPFNGDGIITEDCTNNSELRKIISEIILSIGSINDRSGKPGINKEFIGKFSDAIQFYTDWYNLPKQNSDILFLNENTSAAFEVFLSLKNKINDFFIRCDLSSFDENTTPALNLSSARVESISANDLNNTMGEILNYPLAKVSKDSKLPLKTGINPAWKKNIDDFNKLIVIPILGDKESIDQNDWNLIQNKFHAYNNWILAKSGAEVESLGIDRLTELKNQNYINDLELLINQDLDLEDEANAIIQVDQLVRYYRDIYTLLKNFVTFYDFYSPDYKAIFQAGTLFIDQRSCELCIKVNDFAKHQTMVSYSGMFLMYLECVNRISGEKILICAALTNGDIDDLVVGRNALFYDRNGLDWDATVIKIVDNPISIRQAFWSPYRKVSRFIENQINKFASEQDNKVTESATSTVAKVPGDITLNAPDPVLPPAPKPAPAPFDIGKFVGIFAAIGLALGAIGTALASVAAGFLKLTWWQMPLALAGLLLIISGPSMILAYLKLRKRNLAPILDANGWAINAKALVNIAFGNTLTRLATLPAGSKVNFNDPFTKKKKPAYYYVLFISLLAGALFFILFKLGYLNLSVLGF